MSHNPGTITTSGRSGAHAVLEALVGVGVEQIFASPGSEWGPLWEALTQARHGHGDAPEYTSVGHEELAVAMASGYAKVTRRLPAVVIHTTVGALHASMAMRTAYHEMTPMVVLAGESVGFGEGPGPDPGGQWLAHLGDLGGPAALVERCVKWSARVPSAALLPSMVQRAALLAEQAPSGPVFLSVPMEYLFETMTHDLRRMIPPANPIGDLDSLSDLAQRLGMARHPLIIAEDSGRADSSVALLQSVAERVSAVVVETRTSRFVNFPRDHPLHGGFDPAPYLDVSDVILLCGALAPWHPASRRPQAAETIAVLRQNPLRSELPYWGFPVDTVIAGDIDRSLERILEAIAEQAGSLEPSDHTLRAPRNDWRSRARREADALRANPSILPRWAARALGKALPADAIVVDETLTSRLALLELLPLAPGSFFAGMLGGLGTGLGTALGVKAAAGGRLVTCTIGDGSIGYEPALAAFAASRQLDLPLMIVIFNNSGYLSQKATVPKYFPEGSSVTHNDYPGLQDLFNPDYTKIVEAYGGHGERVRSPDELPPALERVVSLATDGNLVVLDIEMEPVSRIATRLD